MGLPLLLLSTTTTTTTTSTTTTTTSTTTPTTTEPTTSKIKVTAPLTTEPLTAFPITTEIASDTRYQNAVVPERGDSQNMVKDTTKPPTTKTTTPTVPNTDFGCN